MSGILTLCILYSIMFIGFVVLSVLGWYWFERCDEGASHVTTLNTPWMGLGCSPIVFIFIMPSMIAAIDFFPIICYGGIKFYNVMKLKRVHRLHLFKDDCKCSNQPLTFVE
jgi:hypothetical protein